MVRSVSQRILDLSNVLSLLNHINSLHVVRLLPSTKYRVLLLKPRDLATGTLRRFPGSRLFRCTKVLVDPQRSFGLTATQVTSTSSATSSQPAILILLHSAAS